MPDPVSRQVLAILSDNRSHVWSDVATAVAVTHGVSKKEASELLRRLVQTGEVIRDNLGTREPTVRLAGES
jgi:hypothetical protein